MAGARQRLPDRRARRAPVRAHAGARAPALRRPLRRVRRRRPAAVAAAPTREHVADLRIFNPDGSEAELSGNGAREAILYLRRRGWTDRDAFSISTLAGEIRPTITGPTDVHRRHGPREPQLGRLSRGSARRPRRARPPAGACGASSTSRSATPSARSTSPRWRSSRRSTSAAIGPAIEGNELFPNRTNVSWYAPLDDGPRTRLRARIFERGVGETLSSGTGATRRRGRPRRWTRAGPGPAHVRVSLDGGELEVEVGEDLRVNLTGWARPVFEGRLSDDFEKELHETE